MCATKCQTIAWIISSTFALGYNVCGCRLDQLTQAKLHLAHSASKIILLKHYLTERFVSLWNIYCTSHILCF